jgi:hypothetical protein
MTTDRGPAPLTIRMGVMTTEEVDAFRADHAHRLTPDPDDGTLLDEGHADV